MIELEEDTEYLQYFKDGYEESLSCHVGKDGKKWWYKPQKRYHYEVGLLIDELDESTETILNHIFVMIDRPNGMKAVYKDDNETILEGPDGEMYFDSPKLHKDFPNHVHRITQKMKQYQHEFKDLMTHTVYVYIYDMSKSSHPLGLPPMLKGYHIPFNTEHATTV